MSRFASIVSKILILNALVLLFSGCGVKKQPEPGPDNSFYLMPLFETGLSKLTDDEFRQNCIKLKETFGPGNKYHRLGFSGIVNQASKTILARAKILEEEDMHLGVILACQTHTNKKYRNTLIKKDLRNFQWRMDGITWKGYFAESEGTVEVQEEPRDWILPSPSRYATGVREISESMARAWAKNIKQVIDQCPSVIVAINIAVEEELAIGGMKGDDYLADYSPYAISEFRNWLRHTGIYDAATGKYAGEGAPEEIVGKFQKINGHMRSPFYDDSTPADSNGTGISFNEKFGAEFTTWTLCYWDLEEYSEPITDQNFIPAPKSGKGYTKGGFDAPRKRDMSAWWKAWSWDYRDNDNTYPPGNPQKAAFGFRQVMIRNYVKDMADILIEEGLPKDIMYAHQIPGELLKDAFTGGPTRAVAGANAIWTGYLPQCGTVGITRFGAIDTDLITQYSDKWGVFEWHPLPNSKPKSQELYDATMEELNNLYNANCRVLFAGWWGRDLAEDKRFPLENTKCGDAIKDFMASRSEEPLPKPARK